MKKLLILFAFLALSLQLCSQTHWVPQRSKYLYLDSVQFESDINILTPLRLQNSFKLGAVTVTANGTELNILDGALANTTEINYLVGVTSAIQTQINTKAPSISPTFTVSATLPSATTIGAISAAEISWLSGVSSSIQTQINGKAASGHNHSGTYEPVLGNPSVDGYVLSSTTGGVRSWVAQGGEGGGMTYPAAGIALSTGSAWVSPSITNNSANWNTAYGWGNHASAGYLTSQTSHADVVVDGDFTGQGIMLRGATAGSYSILGDNSANWNTAYSWGNHAAAGYASLTAPSFVTGITTPAITLGAVTISATGTELNFVDGVTSSIQTQLGGKEPALGNPASDGYVLSSTTGGTRSWVAPSLGMVYPGAGIALSTGSAWGTSITNNSANWNTAYGWGNHASAGYAPLNNPSFTTGITTPAITFGAVTITATGTELNYTDGVTSSIQTQLDDTINIEGVFLLKHLTINAQTASYTLVLTDDGKLVTVSIASANTLTVPPNASVAFATGTQITICSIGAGQTTITPGSGVTINSVGGALKLRVQYSTCTLIKTATNTWLCVGDIST